MDWYDTSSPIVGVASAATKLNGTTVSGVKSFTGTDDVWVFFAWKPVVDGFGVFLRLQDSVGVDIMTVWMWGLTAFALQGNGHTEFPSFSHTNGVPEYAWLHQAKGSGLNSVTEFYASTTTTKPASPLISWSDGTSTAQAANLMIDNSNGGMRSEWDYLRVADFTIGSSPA